MEEFVTIFIPLWVTSCRALQVMLRFLNKGFYLKSNEKPFKNFKRERISHNWTCLLKRSLQLQYKNALGDFLDGPVVKTLCFQCRGHRVQALFGGTEIPHATRHGQKKECIGRRLLKTEWLFLSSSNPYLIIQIPVNITMAIWPGVMTVEARKLQILEIFGYKIN